MYNIINEQTVRKKEESFTLKITLDHLPTPKQQEIKVIVAEISQAKDVQMVNLFGSYATGKWV
jgi:hypothetical protein